MPGPLLVIGAHLPLIKAWGFRPTAMGFVLIKLRPLADPTNFPLADLHGHGLHHHYHRIERYVGGEELFLYCLRDNPDLDG